MRRGSVTTYADDSRRTSAVMPSRERRNPSNARHEFSLQEEEYESPKGMFISYRSIAFVFVFFLAILIVAAFAGYYVVSPPEDEVPDGLAILAHEDEGGDETPELSASVKPLRYSVELEFTVADPTAGGKARVQLKGRADIAFEHTVGSSPKQLTVNARHLSVKAHRLRAVSPARLELATRANRTDEATGTFVILLEDSMADGNYSLEIEYEARPVDAVALYNNTRAGSKETVLLVSRLKPASAPRVFPTLGEAEARASFSLTLLHPRDARALSNSPLLDSSELSEDVVIEEFGESPRMPSHGLAFAIGSLEHLGELALGNGSSVGHWGCGDERHEFYLQDKLAPIAEAFYELFGHERPIGKLDLLAAPVDFDGSSAPGLIVVKESLFHTGVGSPVLAKTRALLNLIGLVGQQWLGGLVGAKNWTDAWYLEGSVLYLQYALVDKIDQSLEASEDFLVDVELEAMENDGYLISKALSAKVEHNRVEAFDLDDNYRKGACLVRMVHQVLGEDAFARGYADFIERWSHSNADANEFLRSVTGNATTGGVGESPRLDEVFRSWTRQPGYPLITVKWDRDNDTVTIRQEKFNFDEYSSDEEERPDRRLRWWVPLTYVDSRRNNWSEPSVVWLKGTEEMVLENFGRATGRDNDSWVVFNVDKRGYYRVNYDEATWRGIGSALLANHTSIPPGTRAALIDDALSLARQGSLDYGTALELLGYIGNAELDYAPWRALARHASQLDFALYETNSYPEFQEFMRNIASQLFDETKAKLDQGSPLAVLAIQLACSFENQKCTSWARSQWDNVLRDNEYALAKHVRETVYCVGAQRGGREELSHLVQKHGETSDRDEKNRLLSALGCFQTPWILQSTLNEILESDKFDEHDVRVILKSYSKNPAAAQAARRFVQENWKEIVKRFSHSYWTMKAFVEASTSLLFTEHDLNEFNAFRDKNIDSLKAMGHWVALNEMKASSWIFRLKQSFDSLQRWFKSRSSDDI
ncbi:thyrotropin-releasing hormone-degrading ectoenzyme-like [Copidosoma floridanum]|uniref:thyrotropin-releasing hormone-degrading ectoenzyme-like n=1 Tax=Copidosoma floridanum TaxID=29053 RepID=UPI0006C950D2|nr:thyrotropin-releasing hormone-degrading ectoenzyme-like [Copidosoma floridanum]